MSFSQGVVGCCVVVWVWVVGGSECIFFVLTYLFNLCIRTRGEAIGKHILSTRSGRPLVKTAIGVPNASVNIIASVSNGFSLRIPSGSGALIVRFLNVDALATGVPTGKILGMSLRPSARQLSRIIIANCNGFSGSSFANSTGALQKSLLGGIPIMSMRRGLRNVAPNMSVSKGSNRPNTGRDVHVHNVKSFGTSGRPLFIVSKMPIASKDLDNNSTSTTCVGGSGAGVVDALGPSSVRGVAIVGSTTTTSLCNSHTTGNIVLVAAGGNAGKHTGTALGVSKNFSGTTIRFHPALGKRRHERLVCRNLVGFRRSRVTGGPRTKLTSPARCTSLRVGSCTSVPRLKCAS